MVVDLSSPQQPEESLFSHTSRDLPVAGIKRDPSFRKAFIQDDNILGAFVQDDKNEYTKEPVTMSPAPLL